MTVDLSLAEEVKGFLDPAEGKKLYETALEASRLGACLEIGSYCGKSTVWIGAGCAESGGVLFAVDHHRGSEEQQHGEEYFDPELYDEKNQVVDTFGPFRKTLGRAGLEDTVVPLVCRSEVAARMWNTPLGMVFIDGGHSYEAAYTDYNCWARHIVPGGYLLIHDLFEDPAEGGQAPWEVYKVAAGSGLFKELPRCGTLGILRRLKCGEMP